MTTFGQAYGNDHVCLRFGSKEHEVIYFPEVCDTAKIFLKRKGRDRHFKALNAARYSCEHTVDRKIHAVEAVDPSKDLDDIDQYVSTRVRIYMAGERCSLIASWGWDIDLTLNTAEPIHALTFVDLPDIDIVAYASRLDESTAPGAYLLVTQKKYYMRYATMRCYVIDGRIREEKIRMSTFVRYKDGGTTHFTTENGSQFFWPSSLTTSPGTPTWNGDAMHDLKRDEHFPPALLIPALDALGVEY